MGKNKKLKANVFKMVNHIRLGLILAVTGNLQVAAQVIDYSIQKNWLALPQVKDLADVVPVNTNLKDQQYAALADVFFIHPTTLYKTRHRNDNLRIPSSRRITKAVVMNQASIFNGSCRVYVPKYRQSGLSVQLAKDSMEKLKSLDSAYSDIKEAFIFYLNNHNEGRPMVIAGHSQGSYHAVRLLYEFFEGKPLMSQLVVAYIGGHAITQLQMDSMFSSITYSSKPKQTGCIVSWQTLGENAKADYFTKDNWIYIKGTNRRVEGLSRLCTNPLSWDTATTMVPASFHLGSIKMTSSKKTLKKVLPNYFQTHIENGFVIINQPKGMMFNAPLKNYHIYDYNLFYLNIRQNVSERIEAFITKSK
jgi:hypothetical protein